MNRVKVIIAGKDYVFQTTDEDERYVTALAKKLDRGIREIMINDSTVSLTSACILLAMNILDEKEKLGSDADNLRFQIKDYIDEATHANARVEELAKQVEKLENENKQLWNELELYSLKEKIDDH